MTIASGSRHRLAYIAEVTYGTTPSTPAFDPLRITSTTLNLTKDAVTSEEIRSDRQIVQFRHGNKQIGGDISAELSDGDFDDLLQAALCGTWATNVLKAGTTRRSFTMERYFADIGKYLRYTGVEVNSVSFKISPNAMIGVTFGLIGKDMSVASSAISGATYAADTTTAQFDSFTATIQEGGSAIALITEMEIKLENGIEPQFVVGSSTTVRPSIGRSNVTGSLTAYFEDESLMNKFVNETESSISILLTDPAANTLQIDLGTIKYTTGAPDVSGEGSVTVKMDFQAIYDTSDASNIVITRG